MKEKSENKINEKVIPAYLIADASSSRKSVRSLLSELGAKSQQVHVAEGFGDAKDLILSQKPPVIFVGQEVAGAKLDEIVAFLDQALTPGSPRAVFFITNKGSSAEASSAADELVDAILVKPFTFESLKEQVSAVLEEKFFPKPHQKMLNQGLGYLKSNQFEEALKCFQQSQQLDPKAVLSTYYVGFTLHKLGKTGDAKLAFEKGLAQDPKHYRCLLGIIELLGDLKNYAEAYGYARTLAEHHPIPLKKIPDFVRLSVLNLKFQDILEFYKLVDGVESVDDGVSIFLGAGLVVCGLYFLRSGNAKDALEVFKKAEVISKGNPKILTRMMVALAKAKMDNEMNAFLSRMPKEVKDSVELQSALLEATRCNDPMLALKTGLDLVNAKVVDLQILKTTIELSFELNRKAHNIEELIDLAVRTYPDQKAVWDRFRDQASKLAAS